MRITVHIYNRSGDSISLVGDYSDGSGIDIKITGTEGELMPKVIRPVIGIQRILAIKPNSEFNFPLYLTNMYKFSATGTALVSWNAKIPVVVNNSIVSVTSSGAFPVKIRDGNNDELYNSLSQLLDHAINAADVATKMGMVEGICSIRDPGVIPYLQRLLNVREGELRAIETLIQEWSNDQNAEKVIDNYIDTTSNDSGLRTVIEIYHEKHRLLTDTQLSRLLKSRDDAIRFCGILYMRGILDTLHLDALPQLSKDPNAGIVMQCDEILKAFTEILNKNESKSFKKQESDKAKAFGF